MRYFIELSYDGTLYHGWQIQPNGRSIQETTQKVLSTLLRKDVEIVGAGRTDTGVHAQKMVVHFDWNDECDINTSQLVYKLNKILPSDIAIQKVYQVEDSMHARFSAKSRTYHYFLHFGKKPFSRHYSWEMFCRLNFDAMNKCTKILQEFNDFTSFSKTNTDTKTNLCTIFDAKWEEIAPDEWRFSIKANRFLRNMVRAIVGTMVEVGRGRMSVEDFRNVIEQKNRCSAGESVPGHALFLVDIEY